MLDNDPILDEFSACERHAILVHKYFLGIERGRDPGLAEAISHWKQYYEGAWLDRVHRRAMDKQIREIRAHQAEHKLDFETAAREWIGEYAAEWRHWWEDDGGCAECDVINEE